MDPGASNAANLYAEFLRVSSLSSTSGSLLHHMKNRVAKNLGAFSFRLLSHSSPVLFRQADKASSREQPH